MVLFRVVADGTTARIKLVAWDGRSERAYEVPATLDGSRFALVGWNLEPLVLLGTFITIVIAFGLLWALRGKGVIEVRVKMDPAGTDEVMCLQIAHGGRAPTIDAPSAWREAQRRAGQTTGRHAATMIPRISRYEVGVGRWQVHLYGVYSRGGDVRTIEASSQAVTVKRGQVAGAVFDLVPTTAELRIAVHDEPRAGVALWIDDKVGQRVITGADGQVTLQMPLGEHTLHIVAPGIELARPMVIATPRIERLEINLVRERRLADVSGGLSLQPTATAAPAAAAASSATVALPADHGIRVDFAASGQATGAAATVPMPAAPPPIVDAPAARDPRPARAVGAGSVLLGRYRVDAVLGEGAMGVVYRAWDQNLERGVAIKALGAEMRHFPDAMSFFVQEAKALAQLNHPNIVAVYDQPSDGDDTYLVMELVEGRTLESLLADQGRLGIGSAMRIVDQLCAGLAYAHSRKVIHRDIKPANVFVSNDGVVKLGDFGLARVMREISIRKTEIRGTPLYMAPEQITGRDVNHRADLYAVGCTLFELLTGRPPFLDGDVMYHHLHTAPPTPSTLAAGIPAELDALVLACLIKDTTERVASADMIRDGLRTVPRT